MKEKRLWGNGYYCGGCHIEGLCKTENSPWVFRRSARPVRFHCIAEALEGVCGCYIEVVVSQKCMINFWRCFLSHPLRSRCQTKMLYVNFTSDSHWRLNAVCCILALWSSQTYKICADFWFKHQFWHYGKSSLIRWSYSLKDTLCMYPWTTNHELLLFLFTFISLF